ncbi:MAG: hypothetical protein C3F12_00460 [Candidatus Methylomirabilota bacterium]|nr:MAG: hypothetical protein C3F12_00460 [candidate division NC10 bacterium]
MKKSRWVVAVGMAVLTAAGLAWAQGPVVQKVPPGPGPKVPQMPPLKLRSDLAAQRIDFTVVSRSGETEGRVRVTGVVKSVGPGSYETKPRGDVYLLEGPRIVAHQVLRDLAQGQEMALVYELTIDGDYGGDWEFPPTYKLRINYDVDSKGDGNPANDRLERSGHDLLAIFTRAPYIKPRPVTDLAK